MWGCRHMLQVSVSKDKPGGVWDVAETLSGGRAPGDSKRERTESLTKMSGGERIPQPQSADRE